MKAIRATLGVGGLMLGVACSAISDKAGSSGGSLRVTGFSPDATLNYPQSETGTSVQTFGCSPPPCTPPPPIVDVTYNDETGDVGNFIQYPPGNRLVFPGASQLGWSYSTDGGNTFQHGLGTGKVRPPNFGNVGGWDVLWGDPSITHARTSQSFVYIANLAVSHQSMLNAGGVISGSIEFTCGTGQECSFIDGACVARSTNAGRSFSLVAQGCFTHNHDFYDGSSMVADNAGIYAAFNDVTANAIDVWRAPNATAPFALMVPGPFAGLQMVSHPRLRFDYQTNRVYVMALANPLTQLADGRVSGNLFIDYWDGTHWHGPVLLTQHALNFPNFQRGVVLGQPAQIRTGVQFSFDVGTASVNANDDIRLVYSSEEFSANTTHLVAMVCTRDLLCTSVGFNWTTVNFAGEQFNPVVVAQPGFLLVPPVWKVSYDSTEFDPSPAGTTLSFMHDTLIVQPNGQHFPWVANPLVTNTPVCPDFRGYWGDYDDLQILQVTNNVSTFIRTHTDSTESCTSRDQFTSMPVHVSSHTMQ